MMNIFIIFYYINYKYYNNLYDIDAIQYSYSHEHTISHHMYSMINHSFHHSSINNHQSLMRRNYEIIKYTV